MSTILDALRKLQRERAAQSPAKDLRGSITHESAASRARKRGGSSRLVAGVLVLLVAGGGGYLAYRSEPVQALLARFSTGESLATDEELAAAEREARESEATALLEQAQPDAVQPPVAQQAEAMPATRPPRQPRSARAQAPVGAVTTPAESPEILAERARLEAALANARAAQEAQQRAALEAATPAADPPALQPEAAAASQPVVEPAPAAKKLVVAKRKPPTAPLDTKTAVPVAPATAAAKPASKAEPPASRPTSRAAAEPASSAFPEVRVESIRWHPTPERRVASLQFERQSAPEAREGDIVAGVLVYRIDPGAVELRVGSAQRTVAPGP